MKILDAKWRTGNMGCFGVVAVERVDGWKAYLGGPVRGENTSEDEHTISGWGAPLLEEGARSFFPALKERPYAN